MVDKVKPLKIEDSASGTENDMFPVETDPSEDYIATKGVSFENSDTFLAEKLGGVLKFKVPDGSLKPTYNVAGDIDYIEVYTTATQTTANRRIKITLGYDGSLNPTSETWEFYDVADGTTVLNTITLTHTFTSYDLTKTTEATT